MSLPAASSSARNFVDELRDRRAADDWSSGQQTVSAEKHRRRGAHVEGLVESPSMSCTVSGSSVEAKGGLSGAEDAARGARPAAAAAPPSRRRLDDGHTASAPLRYIEQQLRPLALSRRRSSTNRPRASPAPPACGSQVVPLLHGESRRARGGRRTGPCHTEDQRNGTATATAPSSHHQGKRPSASRATTDEPAVETPTPTAASPTSQTLRTTVTLEMRPGAKAPKQAQSTSSSNPRARTTSARYAVNSSRAATAAVTTQRAPQQNQRRWRAAVLPKATPSRPAVRASGAGTRRSRNASADALGARSFPTALATRTTARMTGARARASVGTSHSRQPAAYG